MLLVNHLQLSIIIPVIGTPLGTSFYPIGISGERNIRCHKNRKSLHSQVSLKEILISFKDQIAIKSKDPIKDAFCKIWKIIDL